MKIDEGVLSKLKAEHGDVHVLEGKTSALAFRTPSPEEWDRYLEERNSESPKKAVAAMRKLVSCCLVHPSAEAFEELAAKRPGIINAAGARLLDIAGLFEEFEVKKA